MENDNNYTGPLTRYLELTQRHCYQLTQSRFARCCLWQSPEDPLPCYEPIGLDDVPHHFKAHGIRGMERKAIIQCYWDGCQHDVTRHNFVRHIRDIHLRPFVFLSQVPCQTLIALPFTLGRFLSHGSCYSESPSSNSRGD